MTKRKEHKWFYCGNLETGKSKVFRTCAEMCEARIKSSAKGCKSDCKTYNEETEKD